MAPAGSRGRAPGLLFLALAALSACSVGPDYHRPGVITPSAYKELPSPPPGWSTAKPADGTAGGAWWLSFNLPELSALESRVTVDNQTIVQNEAAYREAQALIGEARAGYFPTIGVTGTATRARQDNITANSASLEPSASWDLDVWGKIRRSVESNVANAQATAADLANAKLSEQATLATTYFELCYQDELIRLLAKTIAAYQRALDITNNQLQFGTAAESDVITARAQLDNARSQMISAGIARAQYEHAIADLIGVPPADLTIATKRLPQDLPTIPVALPSVLLQRRPDIAAAERTMQAQNAQIGVNVAAFYPDISLSAAFGYSGSPIGSLFQASNQLWSLGTSVTEEIFEGGLRAAQVEAARATYDESVATYRSTVLAAFQQVEDNLSGLRILSQQADVQLQADADAARAVQIALNEYEAGTQAYTLVVTEQTLLLSDQETLLQIQLDRLTDSVTLAQALGGDWDTTQLPAHPATTKEM